MLDQSHGVNNNRIEPLLTSHMTFKNHSMHLFPAVVSGNVEKTYPHSAEYPLPQLRGLPYGLLRGLPYRLPNGLPWINNQIYVYGGKRHKKLTYSTYTTITVWKITAAIFFSQTSSTQSFFHFQPIFPKVQLNRPRSIYQYSSMAPRLLSQNCNSLQFPLSLNSQQRLRYKENNTKYRGLTWKPRSHVRILIYRTWPIENFIFNLLQVFAIDIDIHWKAAIEKSSSSEMTPRQYKQVN